MAKAELNASDNLLIWAAAMVATDWCSLRELAVRFTDIERHFVSYASVTGFLKARDSATTGKGCSLLNQSV